MPKTMNINGLKPFNNLLKILSNFTQSVEQHYLRDI